jgi:Fe-S-cluster containining protein
LKIVTQLAAIAASAQEKEPENQAFIAFLRSQEPAGVDLLVQELDATITPQIDCTSCGNCCRSLMINITPTEITRLAAHLDRSEADITEQYIETGANNTHMVMNTIPCHFLANNSCSIYEQRFAECREFPGLHRPQFTSRLFAMFMHYGRCPIIYNVLEEMKGRLAFEGEATKAF